MVLNIVLHIPKNEDQKEIQYDENEEIGEDFLDNAIKIRTGKTHLKLLYKQLLLLLLGQNFTTMEPYRQNSLVTKTKYNLKIKNINLTILKF